MAVSCPEVMYGAYYPYLYGRAGPSRPFYQYERFNQDLYSSTGVPLAASSSTSAGSHSPCSPLLPPSLSSNVAAAAVAQTSTLSSSTSNTTIPTIPLGALQRHITKEEDISTARSDTEGTIPGAHNDSSCSSGPDSPNNLHQDASGAAGARGGDGSSGSGETSGGGRAQYVSATCVVFTHYSGDSASVVDEHFSRALNFSDKNNKEGYSSMSSRNFPPSFWNSNYVPPTPAPTHHQVSDLYTTDGGYSTDPWHAAHYGSYAHAAHAHAAHAHAYHHNMAQYGSLLRLPQQYGHTSRLHHDQQTAHALESAAAYSSYPTMAGLEAQVQESSKDLYWF
ncbi:protein vestigial [Toxorhynchites rutilus septentrionalis]|uniref:protein vestigial n=1 Tax=Toxorhynchites rutilus septentrionalis TaxID=329112 RepID=UPI002478E577|nr:protein vestigial [Toxorhynchites rutilus septentrionalis]XP_055642651.1 protein vestigial [Toxorhynchites rutilus septentrionalis]XP_055642652.1 protein vestigial [Toxorhynchites rutilus septentrionalis]